MVTTKLLNISVRRGVCDRIEVSGQKGLNLPTSSDDMDIFHLVSSGERKCLSHFHSNTPGGLGSLRSEAQPASLVFPISFSSADIHLWQHHRSQLHFLYTCEDLPRSLPDKPPGQTPSLSLHIPH